MWQNGSGGRAADLIYICQARGHGFDSRRTRLKWHSRQIQPEKDHWLREQNKPSGVLRHWSYVSWQVKWSRNSLLLLYDLDLSSQYLSLGSFVLRSGPRLDNCWHLLASRYIWGVKGTWFHQPDFWKSIPHLVVVLWLREQNKPSGSSDTL